MSSDADDLGAFLVRLRARQQPAEHGIPASTRRRVPGLRREEAAQLIGVSNEYYARLERGVARSPSPAVVQSIERAFGLTSIERQHLRQLVNCAGESPLPESAAIRPGLSDLVESMSGPALVSNHRFDVITANELAKAVFFDFDTQHSGNLARFLFSDPVSMRRYRDWAQVAQATAGQLRVASARHPHDARLSALLTDLRRDGNHFERIWSAGEVVERSHGMKRFWIDAVGELDLAYENFELPEDRNLRLVLLRAKRGSIAEDQLSILSSLTSPSAATPQRVSDSTTTSR